MIKKLFDTCTRNKNFLFLIMCLSVHILYMFFFFYIGINQAGILNAFSALVYVLMLYLFDVGRDAERLVNGAYYEILFYSLLSQLILGPGKGYIYYVIGMIAILYYLVPSIKLLVIVNQMVGVVVLGFIFYFEKNTVIFLPEIYKTILPYSTYIRILNFALAVTTICIISLLYASEVEGIKNRLDHLLNHDVLTGLCNRRCLNEIIDNDKKNKLPLYSIIMFDIDNFKSYNDTYGHDFGDLVLKEVSIIIGEYQDSDKICVRWGGEEFLIYLRNMDINEAVKIAEEIRRKVSLINLSYNNKDITGLTITGGVAESKDIKEYEKAINLADSRLYIGKKTTKNVIISK